MWSMLYIQRHLWRFRAHIAKYPEKYHNEHWICGDNLVYFTHSAHTKSSDDNISTETASYTVIHRRYFLYFRCCRLVFAILVRRFLFICSTKWWNIVYFVLYFESSICRYRSLFSLRWPATFKIENRLMYGLVIEWLGTFRGKRVSIHKYGGIEINHSLYIVVRLCEWWIYMEHSDCFI